MQQYWQILGLDPQASADELRSRYRQLVKEWHPDKFPANTERRMEAEARLKLINEAYRALSDPCAYRASRHRNHSRFEDPPKATSDSPPRDGAPSLKWLQTEIVLTYLPLVSVFAIVVQRNYETAVFPPFALCMLLIVAWSMMARNVWNNDALTPELRILWITAMIIFAGIAVPLYFALHARASTA